MPPLLSIANLSHRYPGRDVPALARVSLDVSAGEIFGFLGPNGSGKSTLFRVLSTLVAPQEGEVRFAFSPDSSFVLEPSTVSDIRRHIAVVFQSPSLDKQPTAAENLRHHG